MYLAKGQLTARGIIIGCIGCVVITASSMYTALKMGALPWPIVLVAIVSLFALKALGKTTLNEANVTHTIMSAGAMVAGGLAFTIPGIWILGGDTSVDWWQMLIIALCGTILGLMFTALLRKHFIEDESDKLEYPMGEAAAQTLIAGDGGKTGRKLFGAMGFAGIYTFLRDGLGMIPSLLLKGVSIPGVSFGIYNSPMMLAVGFLVGTGTVVAWFIGALVGDFGLVVAGSNLGFWDVATGQGMKSSLGMGLMMGCGVAIIIKDVLPGITRTLKRMATSNGGYVAAKCATGGNGEQSTSQDAQVFASARKNVFKMHPGTIGVVVGAVALVLCFALDLGVVPSIIIVVLCWVTCAMSAQSVGQSGIDPMEIFGLIVLLIVAACSDVTQVQLFFVAAVIAVACGLAGDVMSDFKAGHVLGTDPGAQWVGEAIGGILGAFVAVGVLLVLVAAYGTDAFGPSGQFISAQATVVATMVGGIPSNSAFLIGLVLGCLLYFVKVPTMMLGLGVYLPFYMSFTAFLGGMAKVVYDQVCKRRDTKLSESERQERAAAHQQDGMIVASGLLGGESIIGVVLALVTVTIGLMA